MPSTSIHEDDHGYLRESRDQVLRALDGLDDYQVRHPMTATGTNLLGVVKHLIGIEAGYLGLCVGHPFGESLPWIDEAEGDLLKRRHVGHRSGEPGRDHQALSAGV